MQALRHYIYNTGQHCVDTVTHSRMGIYIIILIDCMTFETPKILTFRKNSLVKYKHFQTLQKKKKKIPATSSRDRIL